MLLVAELWSESWSERREQVVRATCGHYWRRYRLSANRKHVLFPRIQGRSAAAITIAYCGWWRPSTYNPPMYAKVLYGSLADGYRSPEVIIPILALKMSETSKPRIANAL